ncbi:MAG: amidohydrolase family protein [Verrucomicrobiota bacterium]
MKSTHSCLALRNGKILLPDGRILTGGLTIRHGKIDRIGKPDRGITTLDCRGAYVIPGLIDIHTHGIGWSSTSGALQEYARQEAARGTTAFYPTFFGPAEETIGLLNRHLDETANLRTVPQVAGFRLESPYLARTGAGRNKDLAPIRATTTRRLLQAGGGWIKIWDISPELTGAPAAIRALCRSGVVCSIAHTQCTVAQAQAAIAAGARLVTHLFDTFVMPSQTDGGVYPAGLVDYFLVEDRVACEIIADGTHVPAFHVEKTLRCKPEGRVIFVTDSNFGAGLATGEYDLPQGWGRVKIDGPNNGVRLIDRGMGLAGSALTPIDGFRNTIRMFHKDMAVASRLCSANPARLLGLNKGEIAIGRDADLVVLSPKLDVLYTVVGGKIIFSRQSRD